MVIKCGRREFTVTGKDKIIDNGCLYILITQYYLDGWARINPTVAKGTFKQLLKAGAIKMMPQKYLGKYDQYQFVEM